MIVAVWSALGIVTTQATGVTNGINICEDVANNIFLTNINDCQSYVLCLNGQGIAQKCRDNMYFDEASQSCIPTNSHCIQCQANDLAFYALPKTCNKYVLCFAGIPVLNKCYDDLQYNALEKQCDFPRNVDCAENKCSIFNNAQDIVYVPSANNCSKYFICMDGMPIAQKCLYDLEFNPKCNCCDMKENNECTLTPSPGKKSLYTEPEPEVAHMINYNCPAQGLHFYPHANQNQYVGCLNGKAAIFTCAPGLLYDESTRTCRDLENL